jgi:hypothetical protein
MGLLQGDTMIKVMLYYTIAVCMGVAIHIGVFVFLNRYCGLSPLTSVGIQGSLVTLSNIARKITKETP